MREKFLGLSARAKILGLPNPFYRDTTSLLARIAAGEIPHGDRGGTRFVASERRRPDGREVRFVVTAVAGDAAYKWQERNPDTGFWE